MRPSCFYELQRQGGEVMRKKKKYNDNDDNKNFLFPLAKPKTGVPVRVRSYELQHCCIYRQKA